MRVEKWAWILSTEVHSKLETLVFDIENKSSVSNRPALTRVDSKRFRCVELFPRTLVFRVAPCSLEETDIA